MIVADDLRASGSTLTRGGKSAMFLAGRVNNNRGTGDLT